MNAHYFTVAHGNVHLSPTVQDTFPEKFPGVYAANVVVSQHKACLRDETGGTALRCLNRYKRQHRHDFRRVPESFEYPVQDYCNNLFLRMQVAADTVKISTELNCKNFLRISRLHLR